MKALLPLPCAAILFFLPAGCSTMSTDLLPADAPQGSIEFYGEGGETLGFQVPVYKVVKGEDYPMGNVGVWTSRTTRRVSVSPGRHTFAVVLGTGREEVSVVAVEGKIVPVRISLDPAASGGAEFKGKRFEISLTPEDPIEPEEYDAWRERNL